MTKFPAALIFSLPLLLAPTIASAQVKPPLPAPVTLAWALAALPRPASGVLLALGADRATLPTGTALPGGADLAAVAAAFGEQTQTFGPVTALAPITKIALNEDPAAPDLFADLNRLTAIKMLAASLDDGQWAALTSERGLGLGDLTDERQQQLFHALFRRGRLWVASQDPALSDLPDDKRTDARDVSDQIGGVRIRLGQTAHLYLHDRAGETIFFHPPSVEALRRLHTWTPKQEPPAVQNAVVLRAAVPNGLRLGDLALDDPAFAVPVPLAGTRTAEALMERIASLTHREIYADPHYARRLLTLTGPAPSASAADLLRALALASAGTYRKIGPAYVLTDDRAGVGTRRLRLQQWKEEVSQGQLNMGDQAGAVLLKRRISSARTLPTFGDPVALTPGQAASLKDDLGIPDEDEKYPYAKLTPAQQDLARRTAAAYEAPPVTDNAHQDPDQTGPVILRSDYKVQMLIPTVAGPVDTSISSRMPLLFWPGEAAFMAEYAKKAAQKPRPALPPAPPLLPLLRSRPRRVILGHPRTLADVDALVAAMQKIGLNELWLDVFSGGKSHLDAKGPDILAEALKQAKGTNLKVYADLSLLLWGDAPPASAADLTLLGETSREAAAQAHARTPNTEYDNDGKPIPFALLPVAVSAVSETVQTTLAALVRDAAARPGLAGFVWEDADADDVLGCTLPLRLRFLRAYHADPVDIAPEGDARTDLSLPTFDDAETDKALPDLWTKARTRTVAELLGVLRGALPPSLPVLMEQSGGRSAWLVSWDDPRQTPPSLRPLFADENFPERARVVGESRRQGRAALVREPVTCIGGVEALARALQADLAPLPSVKADNKAPWDGFVLDFESEDTTRGTDPLADLVRAAAPR